MKPQAIYVGILFSVVLVFNSSAKQDEFPVLKGPYLGQKPPGKTLEIFAPGIVTYSSFNHASPAIFTSCKEIYWPSKDHEAILVSKLNNGKWSDPEVLSVLNGFKADCPVISPDGKKMLFNSSHPIDDNDLNPSEKIWFIERIGNGWSTPKPLSVEINAEHLHWQVSNDLHGNVYFGFERAVEIEASEECEVLPICFVSTKFGPRMIFLKRWSKNDLTSGRMLPLG